MKQIQNNRTVRYEKPKYIVIHTTGNPRKGANADAHFRYWNSANVGQSADFVVDSTQALQINDYNTYYTWHCGDGKGKYGITNSNSIGIEICINEDGDFEKAVANTIQLVKRLKKENGITKVVRHYDASRKNCPAEFSANNWKKWHEFLDRVNQVEPVELISINDIVWELAQRGQVTDKEGMLAELNQNPNGRLYWLARKFVKYIMEVEA